LFGFNVETSMERLDRRTRRTQKSLHDALISLVLEKNYDSTIADLHH